MWKYHLNIQNLINYNYKSKLNILIKKINIYNYNIDKSMICYLLFMLLITGKLENHKIKTGSIRRENTEEG